MKRPSAAVTRVSPALLALVAAIPPGGTASAPAAYVEKVPGSAVSFEMVPVPGGSFEMGSGETGTRPDEGPRHRVTVSGFWMGRHEVTWAEYNLFRQDEEAVVRRADEPLPGTDAITRPTPAYADETFGFGDGRRPVISVTHAAAVEYTRWLSRKTGRTYRLPTEAEWEYACRSGADEEGSLDERAWYDDNGNFETHPVGMKKPDRLGLFDLLGNVGEWVLDRYEADAYATRGDAARDPVLMPDGREYPHVVRGGSWDEPADRLRCAARRASDPSWNARDPQAPQSIWWLTDAASVGFRVVRPFGETEETRSADAPGAPAR